LNIKLKQELRLKVFSVYASTASQKDHE